MCSFYRALKSTNKSKEVKLMHYNQFINLQDKLNHLFLAALGEGLYSQAVKESVQTYGEAGSKAVHVFESDYASLIARFV